MENKNKFVIYTGGMALYFFSVLIVMFLFIFTMGIRDLIMGVTYSLIGYFGLFVVIPWITTYLVAYIRSNKIEVTDNEINFSIYDRTIIQRNLWPKVNKKSIKLADIESALLAEARYLREVKNDRNLDKYKQNTVLVTSHIPMPFNTWIGTKYTPFLRFEIKNGGSYLADTKPFGKADFFKLIGILRTRGVIIAIQQGMI